MIARIRIWIDTIKGKGARSLNRDIVVFIFFLVLSFIFWYLNSLRKDFEMDLKYPVRYINPPNDRVIANELPSKLTFNLKGPGYSIIKLKISGNRAPLIIDFSKITYKRIPGTRSLEYYIVTTGLIANFSKQFRSEFEILSVRPDTLFVKFGNKTTSGTSGKTTTRRAQTY